MYWALGSYTLYSTIRGYCIFREVIEDILDSYPHMSQNEAEFIVESHDYWTLAL